MSDDPATAPAPHPSAANPVRNWVLALSTLLGAAAVVIFAFVQVMGTAGCSSDQTCPRPGFGELGFTVLVYGAPAVAVAAIALSFVTARKPSGHWVPIGAWVLILLAFGVLALTFP